MTTLLNDNTRARFIARFPQMFNGGAIDVYSAPRPASPNDDPTGTLLAQVIAEGGLQFMASGTWAMKQPGQEWLLNGLASGTAAWFRLRGAGLYDTPTLDGAVYLLSDPHAGLLLPNLSITPLLERTVDQFTFTL